MGKLFCLMGKSASGKDTIYQKLLDLQDLDLKPIVTGTTRPPRAGETPGVEYHFCTEEQYELLNKAGFIVETREYQTQCGTWKYFTIDGGTIDLKKYNYLMIGTPEMYGKLALHFGAKNVCPIYIQVEDGLRLSRALERERSQMNPNYAEMCRRYLADREDFSTEVLSMIFSGANEQGMFENREARWATEKIADYIRSKEYQY